MPNFYKIIPFILFLSVEAQLAHSQPGSGEDGTETCEPVQKKSLSERRWAVYNERKEAQRQVVTVCANSGLLSALVPHTLQDAGVFNLPRAFMLEVMKTVGFQNILAMRETCKTFAILSQSSALDAHLCIAIKDIGPRTVFLGPREEIACSLARFANRAGEGVNFHPAALSYTLSHSDRDLAAEGGNMPLTSYLRFNKSLRTFIFHVETSLFVKKAKQLADALSLKPNIQVLVLPEINEVELFLMHDIGSEDFVKTFRNIRLVVLKDGTIWRLRE